MHIWFNTHNYDTLGPIVFLERQKYKDKPKFGKLLIKKAWQARTKKFLKWEALNVLYFQCTYGTICTCNLHKKYWPYGTLLQVLVPYMYYKTMAALLSVIRYKLQYVLNTVSTGHTVFCGRYRYTYYKTIHPRQNSTKITLAFTIVFLQQSTTALYVAYTYGTQIYVKQAFKSNWCTTTTTTTNTSEQSKIRIIKAEKKSSIHVSI